MGKWGGCLGHRCPERELCDGKDNDCDGRVDHNFEENGKACSIAEGKGRCALGTYTACQAAKLKCSTSYQPTAEICNGKDDDCDGLADNATVGQPRPLTRECYTGPSGTKGVGVCTAGTETCTAGSWPGTCRGAVGPVPEQCNGKDDDCDGLVDNATTGKQGPVERPCYTGSAGTKGVGECRSGIETCTAGKWPGICVGEVRPVPERCNGKDDDCDGKVNLGDFGSGASCTALGAKGECARSYWTCSSGKAVCVPSQPKAPVCPGLVDADCDGILDCEVSIPAGTFTMGSPVGEPGQGTKEDQHKVTLSRGFHIWRHEVTQGEFQTLMAYNPAAFGANGSGSAKGKCAKTDCPVEDVSLYEAMAFCNQLSRRGGLPECFKCGTKACTVDKDCKAGWEKCSSGKCTYRARISIRCELKPVYGGGGGRDYYGCRGFRLPTESEWEYAYRSGTKTAYYNGACTQPTGTDPNLGNIGWYRQNAGDRTHHVGKKAPNAWGLYDMAGNLWEWVWDRYGVYPSGSVTDPIGWGGLTSRVLRGGCWECHPDRCRAAYRSAMGPGDRLSSIGFRPCRSE